MKRLSVLVATTDERIHRLTGLLQEEQEAVCYVISCQYRGKKAPERLPDFLKGRSDVEVHLLEGGSLSDNRNNALDHWQTDIAVIADDDVRFPEGVFERVLQFYDAHKDADIACFQATDLSGRPIKPYPSAAFTYDSRPKGSYASSVELTFRRHPALPRFDRRFGLGAPWLNSGEEEVFLHDAAQRGLRIVFFPMTLCAIEDTWTTGKKFREDPLVRRSKGAVLCHLHGFMPALLRIVKYALLNCHGLRMAALRDMLQGAWYVHRSKA